MFSHWDLVGPRIWYPMATLEQSILDIDDCMFSHQNPSTFDMPTVENDEEFFCDLPVQSNSDEKQQQQHQAADQAPIGAQDQAPTGNAALGQNNCIYSTYSFSSSSVLDHNGQRVVTTRRRYEDSAGRLKATHERSIQDKTMRSVWNRQSKDDQGQHETICSAGTTGEAFEQAWKQTPFGQAHAKKQAKEIKSDCPIN